MFNSVSYSLDKVRNGFFSSIVFLFFFFKLYVIAFLSRASFSFQDDTVREHLVDLY